MAATPTTKSQVQAYRFVLRRMEHALVRKDAVMLHDPMRAQSRATGVGLVIGILGLAGFALFSVFRPADNIDQETILVSKTSTQTFVVVPDASGTRVLHPVFNLASARLIVGQAATASIVDDKALDAMPRGPELGIVGGPDLLPGPEDRPSAVWTVCDDVRGEAGAAVEDLTVATTVIAGDVGSGAGALTGGQALFVRATDGSTQLLYQSRQGVVRAVVDPSTTAVARALDLSGQTPRPVSPGLLNAVPEVAALAVPVVPGAGSASTFAADLGSPATVGTVLSVQSAAGTSSYALLADGVQEVDPVVAALLQSESGDAVPVGADAFSRVPNSQQPLDLGRYPELTPDVLGPDDARVGCLSWDGTSVADDGAATSFTPRLSLVAGDRLPLPDGARTVALAGADADTEEAADFRLDAFYVQPGRAAVVQASSPGTPLGVGTRYLVADTGTRYGIPDADTANVLGLGTATTPAPEAVLALLPQGTELSQANARRSHNGVAADPDAEPFTATAGG